MDEVSIVIADTHELVMDCIARSLTIPGKPFSVLGQASSGKDIIRLVRELTPDVVIMDTTMPDLNGVDVTRDILATNPGTRIIALSSIYSHSHIMEMLNSGAAGYLLKSCPFKELVRAVELIMDGKIYICPGVTGVLVKTALQSWKPNKESCFSILSRREREVLQLISEGCTVKQIADKLYISPKTVQIHRTNLKKKLDLDNTAALTRFAVSQGITSLEFLGRNV